MPIYGSKFQNLEGEKKVLTFLTSEKFSKIGTLRPSKRPISDIFKNLKQDT